MSILRSLLSVVLVVTLTYASPIPKIGSVSTRVETVPSDYRLPENVLPINYTIALEPHLDGSPTFQGESNIHITVKDPAKKTITLHATDLKFDEKFTTLVSADGKQTVKPLNHIYDNTTMDFVKLEFEKPVLAGSYVLNLKYAGILSDDFRGFYRISYQNDNNSRTWLAVTQFEPTNARRAFPCFDEPAMKASFKISIKHFDNYTAVSNMPISAMDKAESGKIWTHFEVTPVMSTYLVAFAISDYENITSEDDKFRIWARRDQIQNGKFALTMGQKILNLLEDYMGTDHVIPKMDNFATPGSGGAMENWGLVTYGESSLLYNEFSDSKSQMETVAAMMAHEFSHHWFGNLVTPSWWKYTWLKEGFASYFQNLITDQAAPNWRMMDQFVVTSLQNIAFVLDDNELQHAMNSEVNSPQEIQNNFDTITYKKAACVIRMFSHMVGEKAFQTALQKFLKDKSYSTATPADLFQHIVAIVDEESWLKKDMNESLNSWVNEPGYPVLTTFHGTDSRLHFTAKRYLSKNPSANLAPNKWWIPINVATETNPSFDDTKAENFVESGIDRDLSIDFDSTQWYVINKQQTGYYRVNYDMRNWNLLAKYLKTKDYRKIHVLNRAQLLDDSFNLVKSGDIKDYEVFLNISTYLEQEDDFAPWESAYRAFSVLDKALRNTDQYDLFKRYLVKVVTKLGETFGYTGMSDDSRVTTLTKIRAIHLACGAGSENCRNAAHKDLLSYITGERIPSNDLRSAAICSGIRSANATIWEETFKLFEKSNDASERFEILKALGCSSDSTIVTSYLQKTIEPKSKIAEHISAVLSGVVAGDAAGIDFAFNFIKENLEAVNKTLGSEKLLLIHLDNIADRMNTQAQHDKLSKFIKSLPSEKKDFANNLRTGALVKVAANVKWCDKYKNQIQQFLHSQKLVADTDTTIEPPTKPTEPTTKPTEPTTKPTEPTTKPTEPTTKPTEPTTKPTDPTTKPTEPTTKPTEPTTKPTDPTTKPTEPTTKPTEPTTKPTDPTTKPTEPTTKPTEPTTKPTEPTTNPTDPTTKPTESTTKPTDPTTKPTEPTTKPTEPTTKPTEPTTKPTDPTTKPTEPTTKPTEPTTKPTEPTTKPTEPTDPTTKPTEPTTKPTEPTTKPTDPTTKPTEPTTKPTEPTTKPTEPTTKPTDPTTKPTEPTTKPTEPTTKPTEPTTKPTDPTTKPTEPTTKPTDPTTKPTEPPVDPPVEPPVDPSVEPPVDPPVEPPVDPSVEPPVDPPVEPPVDPSVEPPVDPSVEPPVDPSVEPPVDPSVEPPVDPSVEPPVDPSVEPPVDPSVEPPVDPSVEPPVDPSVEPPVDPSVEPPVDPPVEPPVEQPSTEKGPNGGNNALPTLPLTIFLALLARFISQIF